MTNKNNEELKLYHASENKSEDCEICNKDFFNEELSRRIKNVKDKYGLSIKSGTWSAIEQTLKQKQREHTHQISMQCASEASFEEGYAKAKAEDKKRLQEFKEEFLWKSNRECVQCNEYPTTISLFEYLMQKHFGGKLI